MLSAIKDGYSKFKNNPDDRQRIVQRFPLKGQALVCGANRLEGVVRFEYGLGTVTTVNEVAILTFRVTKTPPAKMSNFLKDIKELPPSSDDELVTWHGISPLCRDEISTVLVNVDYSNTPQGYSAVEAIGELCKSTFPNMRPERSAVNVHFGSKHWIAQEVLLPDEIREGY